MARSHKWYSWAAWTKGYRVACLQRDVICQRCGLAPATVVHHKKAFQTAEHPEGDWQLFSDPANHEGLCKPCHDHVTVEIDGGFGNPKAPELPFIAKTGDPGPQFSAGTPSDAEMERLMSDVLPKRGSR